MPYPFPSLTTLANRYWTAAAVVGCFVVPPALQAQNKAREDTIRVLKALQEEQQRSFRKWKGIVAHCNTTDLPAEDAKDLCRRVLVDARFLATAARINVDTTSSVFGATLISGISQYLILEIGIYSTKEPSTPVGMTAIVRARKKYSKAYEDRADSLPRAGDLVMWERVVIGASNVSHRSLIDGMASNIEEVMKGFFADFLEARR